MQLSNEIKTHAVITFTDVHYLITQRQYEILSRLGLKQELAVEGNIIKTNNIADILILDKYYETYPEKKPLAYKELPNYERVVYSKAQLIRALEQMRKGFLKHFGDRVLPPQSQKILNYMDLKIEEAKNAKEEKKFFNPVPTFYQDF